MQRPIFNHIRTFLIRNTESTKTNNRVAIIIWNTANSNFQKHLSPKSSNSSWSNFNTAIIVMQTKRFYKKIFLYILKVVSVKLRILPQIRTNRSFWLETSIAFRKLATGIGIENNKFLIVYKAYITFIVFL